MTHLRAIALYLPQFHPIPENDEWWGRGFTEWRNVTRARPLFPGHYQPHLPADLGFYDLRLAEARDAQAALAREYGIHGFCYYHYWFNGRRVLERPFNEVLASGEPDFPFCLCWANENWTRVWDGGEKDVLLGQDYNEADDAAHIRSLLPAFADQRYIRIDGRPLFLVYRSELLPNPKRTTDTWRRICIDAGTGDPYLVRVEGFEREVDPSFHGFDAALEFAPDGRDMGERKFHSGFAGWLSKMGILQRAFARNRVLSYANVANGMASRPTAPFKRIRCVTPMWDNSARRKQDARILIGSTPQLYETWLLKMCRQTIARFEGDERIVFINAWNEWAEGNHLEPDQRWGRAYLEATRNALGNAHALQPAASVSAPMATSDGAGTSSLGALGTLRHAYWRLRNMLSRQREIIRYVLRRG